MTESVPALHMLHIRPQGSLGAFVRSSITCQPLRSYRMSIFVSRSWSTSAIHCSVDGLTGDRMFHVYACLPRTLDNSPGSPCSNVQHCFNPNCNHCKFSIFETSFPSWFRRCLLFSFAPEVFVHICSVVRARGVTGATRDLACENAGFNLQHFSYHDN